MKRRATTARRGVYAYVCTLCDHLTSQHGWKREEGGNLHEGPYSCSECGCSISQDGPTRTLNERQYREFVEAMHPEQQES